MLPLFDSLSQLGPWLAEHDVPSYREGQIRRWLFERRAGDWAEMTDLPTRLREALAAEFTFWNTSISKHTTANDGTEKLLFEFHDGQRVESVLLRGRRSRTLCISTQVGCGMKCAFCASGVDGFVRNLTTGQIVEQMLRLQRLLPEDERLSHLVVMGMGEPLANLNALLPALDLASHDTGLGISARRITISTVGLPGAIDRLAKQCLRYRLAVSLHAPDDRLRDELVPTNRGTGLATILAAADRYFEASGRRLTYEYVLLAGVNDQPEHAHQLAKLLAGRTAMVNVIPYNPVDGMPYKTPSETAQKTFHRILQDAGLAVRFRRRRGNRIDAACGQLRRSQSVAVKETTV